MPSNEIIWLTQEEFKIAFDLQSEPVRLRELVTCEVSFAEAKSLIPAEPIDEPPDTVWQYPGPVALWYGRTQGLLFVLTGHKADHLKILEITIQPDRKHVIAWQQMRNLKEFPAQFLRKINWVKSPKGIHYFALEAQNHEYRYEMYFGEKEECIELAQQLKTFESQLALQVKELAEPCEITY